MQLFFYFFMKKNTPAIFIYFITNFEIWILIKGKSGRKVEENEFWFK